MAKNWQIIQAASVSLRIHCSLAPLTPEIDANRSYAPRFWSCSQVWQFWCNIVGLAILC